MSDEQPKKKVVRRVVKKTVAPRQAVAPGGRVRTITNPHTGRTVTIDRGASTPEVPAVPTRSTAAQARRDQREKKSSRPEAAVPVTPRRSARDVWDDWRLAASEHSASLARAARRGGVAVGSA
ncbi:MAG: hypothetical protein QM597_01390, partial [Aeromicrobium sp.]|uniref:hypothetical protein n=1 Tax=Aeromicrobium sp. TaxID=1871063 RepID=UPI0039E4A301